MTQQLRTAGVPGATSISRPLRIATEFSSGPNPARAGTTSPAPEVRAGTIGPAPNAPVPVGPVPSCRWIRWVSSAPSGRSAIGSRSSSRNFDPTTIVCRSSTSMGSRRPEAWAAASTSRTASRSWSPARIRRGAGSMGESGVMDPTLGQDPAAHHRRGTPVF